MEKEKALVSTTIALTKLDLNPKSHPIVQNPQSQTSRTQLGRPKSAPTLLNLCLGVVGSHLEDLIPHLADIALDFPSEIKRVLVAIARRRKLLKDDVIIALADESWDVLDLSGSDVSDLGLAKVAEICGSLRAVDISRCDNITAIGVSELVHRCLSLETLRCGGSRNSNRTARSCLDVFKPELNNLEGDSWEELKTEELGNVADMLRWLVWPQIDKDSLERYSTECPRIIVNPKPSPFGFSGTQVSWEALPDIQLDNSVVKDIDPKTWVTWGFIPSKAFPGSRGVLPLLYSYPRRPKSMPARTSSIRAATKKSSTQVKLLTRVEQLKLLTKAEKAGLLSAAEKSGLSLSAIEKLGLLSKAEESGVLSAATDPGTPGALLTLSFGLLLLGPLSVFLVPEDYPWEVVVQAVVAAVSVVGGSAAFGASNFVSNLQKSN